ncbi:unnamed protein product [Echinostoma caproni]|uniref:Ubiquitin-like domain-containing protein n=1 Tax=Echinostoma caproni TaxID=27848 RepID=A0A183B9Y5_9TREM|nr:unnamed protein product [Echinostoma caproni]
MRVFVKRFEIDRREAHVDADATVADLGNEVRKLWQVPPTHQVHVINGDMVMNPSDKLSFYGIRDGSILNVDFTSFN